MSRARKPADAVQTPVRAAVADYIGGQEEHHRHWSLDWEFMTLVRKAGAAYEERYVFG